MSIALVTGPANAGKARVVMDALRAHHARGEEPLLVVPTRTDVERYRNELARSGLLPGARVERFGGLLAEAIRRSGSSERPLGALAGERVLATVLRRAQPERSHAGGAGSSHVRATPGVVRALAALVAELEAVRVSTTRLHEALEAWAAADPTHRPYARELGELYGEYRRTLEELGRAGPERRAALALDALRRAPALWGSTPVLLYGFDDLGEQQLDTVETLGVVVGAPVTVSLAYEPSRTAFAGRGDTFQRLLPLATVHHRVAPRPDYYAPTSRSALHHLERFLFEPASPPAVSAGGAVQLLEGGGERAEFELVAEEIRGLLERGVPPAEIAVAHRSPESIAELLGEVFRAYRIPFALKRRLPFTHTALGRALVGLLVAAFPNAEDAGVGHLLAWLRAPGVLERPELADDLERRARRTGVSSAARARALWEAEHGPLETLDRLAAAAQRGPVGLVDHVAQELERLSSLQGGSTGEAFAQMDLLEVPPPGEPPEARALATGRAVLEELRELARVAPELAPDAHGLIAILHGLGVEVAETHPGAPAVAVLDPLALRARRVRVLFVCGLQEGVFPAPAQPEPFLSEEDRRALAEASGLRLGRAVDALAAERYLMYAAVSRPEELLVLSWHTANDDGVPSARSLFVDDVCDLFACDLHAGRNGDAGQTGDAGRNGEAGGRRVSPGFGPTRRALGEVGEGRSGAAGPGDSPAGPSRLAALSDPRVLAELCERRLWSASSLQAWAGCPVRWFVERLLYAEDLEPDPEPLARGSLAHAALRDVLEGLKRETGSARLPPERMPRARELLHAALERHAGERPLSTEPERVPGVRRRLEADLERYLEHAARNQPENGHEDTPMEPTHLELPFGFPEEPGGLPALDLGDGVLVRGRIDRVDLAPGGEAVVYDYKGTLAPPPDKWGAERSFQVALYMRAVEQLPNVRAVGGFYQPLSGRDLRARGVLAREEGVELHCVRGDAREPAEVRELVEEVLAAARTAAAQARAGELEARPQTCGFGGSGCVYPAICRCVP
jgi:ATP-dependent helicase/DNAse subunit B